MLLIYLKSLDLIGCFWSFFQKYMTLVFTLQMFLQITIDLLASGCELLL